MHELESAATRHLPVSLGDAREASGGVSLGLLTLLAVITSFGALSLDLYLPGLPQLQRDLGASSVEAQLTVTSCIAGLAVGQLISGLIADMAGRRPPLLLGSALWTVATFCCSLAA